MGSGLQVPSAPQVVSGVATSLVTESVESGVVEPSASVAEYSTAAIKTSDKKMQEKKYVRELNHCQPTCRPWHIPLDHCLALPYSSSGTMYRPMDENFFSKIETYFGFPHDSNYRATKRKVCLGPGTEIQGTGNLFC